MKEAIKDKEIQVQKQMEDEAGNQMGFDQGFEEQKDSDSDFNSENDDDDIMRSIRDDRLAAMKSKHTQHQENMAMGHGQYTEITEEQFLPLVTKTKFVILHFFHKDFERCKIIDMHLRDICRKHTESKFALIDAEKCPFFVTKLNVQMLPSIICFMDGVSIDRIIGFEELGGVDDFPTLRLTRRLVNSGCIKGLNAKEKGQIKIRKGNRRDDSSDNDDSDC